MITYVKEDIAFKTVGHCKKGPVEALSVGIQQKAGKWWTVNNIYIPRGEIDLSFIPMKNSTIHAGDFNAHSSLWDDHQPDDSRGDYIVDWMLDNNLACMNDGSPTRANRATAGLSTPAVTFVSDDISTKVKWTAVDETDMGSDHLPIVIEISNEDF